MTRLFCAFAFAFLFATVAFSQAVEESPEPVPMDEGLYLYTAGTSPKFVSMVKDGMTFCPRDYPTGFNIMCNGESSVARFYLNGKLVMKEYKAPFYIAGDVRGRVRPWEEYPKNAYIRCVLFKPRRNFRANIQFRC